MIISRDVVKAARNYLGCKYQHQGRVRAGLDCLGLVIRVCHDLSISDLDWTGYSSHPDGKQLKAEIEKHCTRLFDIEDGALLLFKIRHHPQHVGIASPIGMIHSYQGVGQVVEHSFDEFWGKRVIGIYRLPGVCNG